MRKTSVLLMLAMLYVTGCKRADVLATEVMVNAFDSRDMRVTTEFERTVYRDTNDTIQNCLIQTGYMREVKGRRGRGKAEWTKKAVEDDGFIALKNGRSRVTACRHEFVEVIGVRNVDLGREVELAYSWKDVAFSGMASCIYVSNRSFVLACPEGISTARAVLVYDKDSKEWVVGSLGL